MSPIVYFDLQIYEKKVKNFREKVDKWKVLCFRKIIIIFYKMNLL